jgi:hypothetical protein
MENPSLDMIPEIEDSADYDKSILTREFREIENVPYYLTDASRRVHDKLGRFNYDKYKITFPETDSLFNRKPVMFETEDVYIGQWDQDNNRCGRGI